MDISVTTIPPTVGDLKTMLSGFPDHCEVSMTENPGGLTLRVGTSSTVIRPIPRARGLIEAIIAEAETNPDAGVRLAQTLLRLSEGTLEQLSSPLAQSLRRLAAKGCLPELSR